MSEKEKYLQKVKKLLALARNNSSSEEASRALAQAQNLMRKHQLSEDEVGFSDVSEASTKRAPSHAEKMPEYVALLAQMISEAFGVDWYTSHGRHSYFEPVRRVITYFGPAERPQIAAYAFEVLARQLNKARREYIGSMRKNIKTYTKTARADTFCSAWVDGAWHAISKFVVTEAEETLMQSYASKKFGSEPKTLDPRAPGKARGTDDAEMAGYVAGTKAELNRAVGGAGGSSTLAIEG